MSSKAVTSTTPHFLSLDAVEQAPASAAPETQSSSLTRWNALPRGPRHLVFSFLKPKEETCLAVRVCKDWSRSRYTFSTTELFSRLGPGGCKELTHSNLSSYEFVSEYFTVLRARYPNVRSFEIRPMRTLSHQEAVPTYRSIVLALPHLNLHALSINEDCPDEALRTLAVVLRMQASNLTTLKLPRSPVSPFFGTLGLSSPTVQRLEFASERGDTLKRKELKKLARNFPSLRSLKIDRTYGKLRFDLKALLERLPHLQALTLKGTTFTFARYGDPTPPFPFTEDEGHLALPWEGGMERNKESLLLQRYIKSIHPTQTLRHLCIENSDVELGVLKLLAARMPATKVELVRCRLPGTYTMQLKDLTGVQQVAQLNRR